MAYKLQFFVPETALEKVKSAVFEAGAGSYKNYDQCCWQTKGQGQFRPLKGADPHIGEVGKLEVLTEYKVELLVQDKDREQVLAALKKAHPYQEPAYFLIKLEDA
jgi:hypothetical protein